MTKPKKKGNKYAHLNDVSVEYDFHGIDPLIGEDGIRKLVASKIYDFINFRRFRLKYASSDIWENCGWNNTYIVPMWTETSGVKSYAWAGKSQCFNSIINPTSWAKSNPAFKLRLTKKHNPFIVEYNNNLTKIQPSIIKQ